MKDFLTYFFGVGTEVEFTNFSLAHFVPILLTILTIFLIYKNLLYPYYIRNDSLVYFHIHQL